MDSNRKTAIIVGALFLISYFGIIVGAFVISQPILDAPDYLANVYPNRTLVIIGGLLESTNGVAIVGIAVLLFPILRKQNEGLALGYVGFRVMEAIFGIVSVISLLSLITLSQEYLRAGVPDASIFQTLGAFTLGERVWASEMLTMFLILGGPLLYYLLYQSKLIPRFISVWGFVAIATLSTNWLITLLGFDLGSISFILLIPIMGNEIFLAIWLIVKGFNSSAIASLSAKTDTNPHLYPP